MMWDTSGTSWLDVWKELKGDQDRPRKMYETFGKPQEVKACEDKGRAPDCFESFFDFSGEALSRLTSHPLHLLLGWFVNERVGLCIDVRRFKSAGHLLKVISEKVLAQVLFAFIKSGK
jgi:hypothetical protein